MSLEDEFHKHLDTCKQCREKPFELCPVGQEKIAEAVKSLPLSVAFPGIKTYKC